MRATALGVLLCCGVGFGAEPVASTKFTGGEQGRIQVQAFINNQGPFWLVFDTGSMSVISLDLAKKLNLQTGGEFTVQAFGGGVKAATTLLDSIKLGDLTMQRLQMVVINDGPFVGSGLAGMLGREFLAKLVAEVDYEHGTLKFFDPQTYAYTGRGTRIPVMVGEDGSLNIPARVYGSDAAIEVDAGSEAALVLFPAFVQKHALKSKLVAVTGYGYGGDTHAMVTRAPLLQIGSVQIENPIVQLSMDKTGIGNGATDGNIGGPLLREFTCVYDLPHHSLYLEPNDWYGKPELADHSGLVLDTRGNSARVLFVYPDSPAAKAGIVAGEELADANGRELTGDEWHDWLDGAPGTVVHLTAKRGAHARTLSFALKQYL